MYREPAFLDCSGLSMFCLLLDTQKLMLRFCTRSDKTEEPKTFYRDSTIRNGFLY